MSLFSKDPAKAQREADHLVKRAKQLSELSDPQIIMYALATMVDGCLFDQQVLDEFERRYGSILPHLDQ